jgi:hypothetical protein
MRSLSGSLLALALAACASDPKERAQEIEAYCQRWTAKYAAAGTHANPAANREDLMSTCMALKGLSYQPKPVP